MFDSFLSILYPKICVHCKHSLVRGESNLCTSCLEKLPVNERINDFHDLRRDIFSSFLFKNLFYYLKFYKSGLAQSLLHQIKYEGNTELAEEIGLWYGSELVKKGFKDAFDLIIPVPLHKKKLRKRGYNQSEYIARGLLNVLNSEMDLKLLLRVVNNPTQTHKNRIERMENVSKIFRLSSGKYSADTKILLVDDVITTGATLESCARVLKDGGYSDISFATIAYAKK